LRNTRNILAEKAIGDAKRILGEIGSIRILEIGTGSGAITLSLYSELAQELPDNKDHIKIISTDISKAAIEIAVKNAESILEDNWKKNIKFINCDVIPEDDPDWAADKSNGFNLIISNPPLSKIRSLLSDRFACVLFETDPIVGKNLIELAGKYLKAERIILEKDYNQKDRILSIYI